MTFAVVAATNTSNVSTDATSHTVNLPASISAGDLLVIKFGWTSNLPQTITWPAGYTPGTGAKVEQSTIVGIDAAYRWADGTEGATISVTTSGLTKSTHNSYRITGAENPSTQAPEFAAVGGTSASAPNPPNLVPTGGSKDYLWLAAVNSDGETDVTTAPTNYTNLITASTGITGATSVNCRMGSARRDLAAASEDPGAFNNTGTTWTGLTVAIHPAGAGVSGTIAVTQASQAAAFTGIVANPITGTIGVTQQDQVGALVGSLGISGTIAATQQDQTAAIAGSVAGADWDCADWDPLDWATDCAPTGVLASTQDNQTAAFAGTVANPISGTIAVIQQDQTAAFLGTTVSDGVLASIQQNQTAVFTGTVANPITGTIGVTQANQTAAFTGAVAVPAVTGTIGVTQQDQIAAFVGQSVSTAVTGTIASTQQNQTMAAAGVVAMAVTGTIAVTQQNQTGSFAGAVANPSDTLVVSVSCTIGGPSVTCTISPEMAVVGSDVYITTNYTNAAGQPANPASVAAVVEAPDGTQTTPTPTSITLGEWTTIVPTDQHGFWFFEITGEGDTVNVVCKGSFCVERSLVSV